MIDDKGYYSYSKILSFNCTWNFVLGDRGRGKTWQAISMLANLPEGESFMCLYRNVADLAHGCNDWIDTLVDQGWEPERWSWVKVDEGGRDLMKDGHIVGHFRCLTQVNHIKLEKFKNGVKDPKEALTWIFFDEFIAPVQRKLNLGGITESDALRIIYKTIDHDTAHPRESRGVKPLRVICVGNPFTWNSEILSGFKVTPSKGYGVYRTGPGIALELLEPFEGVNATDKFLGDEVNKSQGWCDELSHIEKRPKDCHPWMSLRLENGYFGIWVCYGNYLMYCARLDGHMKGCRNEGIVEGLTAREECLQSGRGKMRYQALCKQMYDGSIRYENVNDKMSFIRGMQSVRTK